MLILTELSREIICMLEYLYLYKTVHVTFLGLRFIKCADSHFELRKVKVCGNKMKVMLNTRIDRLQV